MRSRAVLRLAVLAPGSLSAPPQRPLRLLLRSCRVGLSQISHVSQVQHAISGCPASRSSGFWFPLCASSAPSVVNNTKLPYWSLADFTDLADAACDRGLSCVLLSWLLVPSLRLLSVLCGYYYAVAVLVSRRFLMSRRCSMRSLAVLHLALPVSGSLSAPPQRPLWLIIRSYRIGLSQISQISQMQHAIEGCLASCCPGSWFPLCASSASSAVTTTQLPCWSLADFSCLAGAACDLWLSCISLFRFLVPSLRLLSALCG